MTAVDRLHQFWEQARTRGPHGLGMGKAPQIVGGVILVLVLGLWLVLSRENWNFLRGPVSHLASARTGRAVRIDGDLRAHLLSFTPEVDVGGLKVGNPAWAGSGDVAQAGQLRLKVKLLPLLVGRLDLPLVQLQALRLDLLRDLNGRETWTLDAKQTGKPLKLPPIRRFIISNGQLHLTDQIRKIVFTGTVEASERPTSAGGRGFVLNGQGTLNKEPFLMDATGGPLLEVQHDRPYPFRMDIHAGPTHALIAGAVTRPFDLGGLRGGMTISGPDLARLYDLTGLTFPSTPTYNLSAHFERRDTRYSFTQLHGAVGASDLQGALTTDRVDGRRKLTADLTSRRLYFPDLMRLLGGTAKATAAATAAAAPSGRLMPDAPLYKDRLRAMDADVQFRAHSIKSGLFNVRSGALGLKLDRGLLTLDPLDLELGQGRLTGTIRIDGRDAVVKTDLDMRLTNVALQQFLKQPGSQPAIEGMLQARAKLHGSGDSVHRAASTANGQVVFVAPHGSIRQAFAELLGINVGRGLFLLLSKDPKRTDMRCAVAQFDVHNGLMQAKQVVIDTGVVTSTGSGTIDLNTERLNLKLSGKTKHPELLRLWTPINLTGTFAKPSLGVDAGQVAAQSGLAVGIGALLGPLTTILPFLSPGLVKDADCAGLIADARRAGAPVKVVARPATAPQQH